MRSLRILVDMDDVLVDFSGGACRIHGWDPSQVGARLVSKPGTFFMQEAMEMPPGDFWRPIDLEGELFWMNLEPTPWAAELLRLVGSLTDDWHIVSDPIADGGPCENRYLGKLKWLQSYFGPRFDRFHLTPHKHLFANDYSILIDDREANLYGDRATGKVGFIEAGGDGLLFPAYCNRLHPYRHDPLGYLVPLLEERFNASLL